MLKIGLTGGIGSGKSTIAKVFNLVYDIPIFEADKQAKQIMNTNLELIEEIIKTFGKESYKNKTLNTKYLSQIVFNNPQQLEKLNNLVHAKVRHAFAKWVDEQNTAYVIQEAAILVESGAYKHMNKIISVSAPQQLRIDRVIKRDKMTTEQVLQRMTKQLSDVERNKHADFVIVNDDTTGIIDQIDAIHTKLIKHG